MNRRSMYLLALAVLASLLVSLAVEGWVMRDIDNGLRRTKDEAVTVEELGPSDESPAPAIPAATDERERSAGSGERRAIAAVRDDDGETSPLPLVVGRVLDPEGGGVPGARVLLTNEYNPQLPIEAVDERGRSPFTTVEVATDAHGKFWLHAGLEPRRGVSLVVQSSGYQTYRLNGAWLYPDRTLDLGDLGMQPGAALTGRVVDSNGTGVPARLVRRVSAEDRNMAWGGGPHGWGAGMLELGECDADGRFALTDLPPGRWELGAEANGYRPGVSAVTTGEEGNSPVEIVLKEGARISGKLKELPPGEGQLYAYGRPTSEKIPPRTASIDQDGTFELNGLTPGEVYKVGVFRSGQDAAELTEVVPSEATPRRGRPVPLTLTWRTLPDLELQLIDASTGGFVEQADVVLFSKEQGTRHLETSRFPGGRVHVNGRWMPAASGGKVRVRAPGYLNHVLKLEEAQWADSSQPLTVSLKAGPTVTVQVRDTAGAPVAGAEVRLAATNRRDDLDQRSETAHLRPLTWHVRRGFTTELGNVTLSDLSSDTGRPRDGLLAVFADGLAPAWVDFASGASAVEVTLSAGATLLIRASDTAGQSLDGVIVELQRFDGSAWPMKAGSTIDGTVTFPLLPPGPYRYRARIDGSARRPKGQTAEEAWISVHLREGDFTESPLECQGFYDLTGRIDDQSGPLAGAQMVLLPGDRTRGEYRWSEFHTGRGSRFHVQTRVDGTFLFHVIPEGTYTLLVEHSTRSIAARIRVEVSRNQTPLALHLASTTVEGTVTFPGNRPAAHAHVSLVEADGPSRGDAYTDEHGRFIFTGVPSGRPLAIRAGGRFVDHEPQALSPLLVGEARTVDLVGEERGAIRFTLVGGEPDSFRVQGQSADGLHKAVMVQPTESNAIKETSHLIPGTWVFQLKALQADGSQIEQERRIEVNASQIHEISLELE
jgi:protocatechuate 3,4-dioxygenase beta subunit